MQWYKTGVYTLVHTKSADIRVKWAGDILPPGIYVGQRVNLFGRFKTYNDGKIFMVVDALPFQGSYREIAKPALHHLYAHADDPRDWSEAESIKNFHIIDLP